MAYSDMAPQAGKRVFVEDLGHKTHAFMHPYMLTVGNRDSRGFLSPVLKRKQPEKGETGDILSGCEHAEDAALLIWSIVIVEKKVSGVTVCFANHVFCLTEVLPKYCTLCTNDSS
jgi:hypothetical protein